METKIKDLFEAILRESTVLLKEIDLFGEDSSLVNTKINRIIGMKDAFQVVAGQSYADYLLARK